MDVELTNEQIFLLMDLESWFRSIDSPQLFQISGKGGTGKAQPLDIIIPTPTGNTRFGDLKVGDYVFNRLGAPVKVLHIFEQGKLDAFKVTLEDGRNTICSKEHLWTCLNPNNEYVTIELQEMFNNAIYYHKDKIYRFDKSNYYRIPLSGLDTTKFIKIISIEDLGYKTDMRCIYVDDPEHLYLTNDYIVTHNTFIIKRFIENLGLTNDEVLFTAFMGKACNQMAKHGLPAKTIHSAIYDCKKVTVYDNDGNKVIYNNGSVKTKNIFELKERLPKKIKLIVVDEGSMVGEKLAKDLMSFGIPMIILGDLNQLPPVMDKQFFLTKPDFVLTKIMRQHEGNPIIYLADRVLEGHPLEYGIYGNSAVIRKSDLSLNNFKNTDCIITATNKLRCKINNIFRENILGYTNLDIPHMREKVICKRNNWNIESKGLFLTNGTSGFITDIDKYCGDKFSMNISMVPDFDTTIEFRDLDIDLMRLNTVDLDGLNESDTIAYSFREKELNKFEYAYALTAHSTQGSEYSRVLFMCEDIKNNKTYKKKLMYTAISRARDQIIIVK